MRPQPDKIGESGEQPEVDINETYDTQRSGDGQSASSPASEDLDATYESQTSNAASDQSRLDETYESALPDPEIVLDATQATEAGSTDSNLTERSKIRQTFNLEEATMASRAQLDSMGSQDFSVVDETQNRDGVPEKVGRYEVRRLLGEGAFGRVYEARDPQLDRRVAVKVAKSISRKTQVKRFLREARAAAKLRHPNIIPVYEYGQVDNENIIVYEFVEGETLKSYIRRQEKISLEDTVRIVREIANGLDYAHKEGIIHRDMKPDNVLIDSNGKPHIADFGCARSVDDQTNLTIDGSILGTPMYMSPEQAGGKSHKADGRTDIWSLGVMLYEMASGERPFFGKMSDLLFWICNNDAKPLRKVDPEIPIDIETICSKCLTRELDGRFATAKELADELARFENGEPIVSRRIGTLQRTWMWAKRNQAVASLLATVAASLIIGITVSTVFGYKAYRAQLRTLEEQKIRAMAQVDTLTTAESTSLDKLFEQLEPYRDDVLQYLDAKNTESDLQESDYQRIRLATARIKGAPVSAELKDKLLDDLLVVPPGDFFLVRDVLTNESDPLVDQLWQIAQDYEAADPGQKRFRAAAALATFDSNSELWTEIAHDVTSELTRMDPVQMGEWLPAFKMVRDQLEPTLKSAFLNRDETAIRQASNAAVVIANLYPDRESYLVDRIPEASFSQLATLTTALSGVPGAVTELRDRLKKIDAAAGPSEDIEQQTNVIIALLQLGEIDMWEQLDGGSNHSVAARLIESIGPSGTTLDRMAITWEAWDTTNAEVLAGTLLSLGQYHENQIAEKRKANLKPLLEKIFEEHPDARVHSSARWLLNRWNYGDDVTEIEKRLRSDQPRPGMNWHVDLSGNTFALFGPIDGFEMGLQKSLAVGEFDTLNEPYHTKRISRRFGICIHEVTISSFEVFEKDLILVMERKKLELDNEIKALTPDDGTEIDEETKAKLKKLTRSSKQAELNIRNIRRVQARRAEMDKALPIGDIDYLMCLAYCRWMSERNQTECGLPSMEQFISAFGGGVDFAIGNEQLKRLGYRIPTASEWEFACRGTTETVYPFGTESEMAKNYAWYATNSGGELHKVGLLKPGVNGLFDVLGNASEWCIDWYFEGLPSLDSLDREYFIDFGPEFEEGRRTLDREYRGGSYGDEVFDVRSSRRFFTQSINGFPRLGFRLARTYE